MMVLTDTDGEASTLPKEYNVTHLKIQTEGVYFMNTFYFHREIEEFQGKEVEVRFLTKDYSKIFVVLTNRRIVEARPDIAESCIDLETVKVHNGVVKVQWFLYHHPMMKRYEGKEITIRRFADDLRIIRVYLSTLR